MGFTGKVERRIDRNITRFLKTAQDGVLPIVQVGETVLRQPCVPYNGQLTENTLEALICVMHTTMLEAPGVGLAAPQIGLNLAIAVVEDHIYDPAEVDSTADTATVHESFTTFTADTQIQEVAEATDAAAVDEELAAESQEPYDDPRELGEFPFHEIINPSYEPVGDELRSFFEGCLSFHGYQAVRGRWRTIKAHWQDRQGTWHHEQLQGWPARIFQHETDHLHGEIYLDQAIIRSLTTDDNLSEFWSYDPVPTEAAKALGFEI